ncbi:MAG TPA: ribonuclease HI family protein [Anaerolineae bacterium]|nr:ribonuclease HI family protein [Anaerolineae bacterium]
MAARTGSRAERRLKVTLVFDGGSKGNPGPTYGSYWLTSRGLKQEPVQRMVWGEGTNNEAEYRSLIQGLRGLLKRLRKKGIDAKKIALLIKGDSKLVLNQVAGNWKTKNPRLRELRDEALPLTKRFGEIRFVHQERSESVKILGH